MVAIELKDVTRRFGDKVAIDSVSLAVPDKEFLVLLGPSGCGKSTLLRMIAGLETLTSGSIMMGDRRVDGLEPGDRDLAFVFQSYALYPHMSVEKNIAFPLIMANFRWWFHIPVVGTIAKRRLAKRADIRDNVREIARVLELTELLRKHPGTLSGGQRQRVAVARAMVRRPAAFLMDEPLSNLDAKLRIEMRAEIRRIHRQLERATIYVTHDQDEALSMADRIVVMRTGEVQQVGTPREVYGRPHNLHVARFMGYRNVLPFRITRRNGAHLDLERGGARLAGTGIDLPDHGADVAVAMRPDDFALTGDAGPDAIDATVRAVEFGGRDSLLHVESTIGDLFVRLPGTFGTGDRVRLSIPADRVLAYAEAA